MRSIKNSIITVLSVLLFFGCSNEEQKEVASSIDIDNIHSEQEIEQELLTLTTEIFKSLKDANYERLGEMVDSEYGITFAFYPDFGNPDGYGGQYITLSQKELSKNNPKEYVWGYDESSAEYKMTVHDYIQKMLLKRWGKEDVDYKIITFNKQTENYAGVKNTIHEYYPDAKYVEYYSPGEEYKEGETHPSFQSLRFIYQEKNNKWYLIGIARNVATT